MAAFPTSKTRAGEFQLDSRDCHMGVSQNQGYHLGDPHSTDYSILGSILGSPYLGN